MSMRSLLLKAFGITSRPSARLFSVGSGYVGEWDYSACYRDAYAANPYAHRCVSLVAMCVSSVPVTLYTERKDGSLDEVLDRSHPLLLVLRGPNEAQGWVELVDEVIRHFVIGGRAFLVGVPPRPGAPPVEVWPVSPADMSVLPGSTLGMPAGFRYSGGSDVRDYVGDDARYVLWLHGFDGLSPWSGLPPAVAARYAITANTSALRYNAAVLQNGGIVGTLLKSKAELTDEEAETKLRQFEAEFMGPSNAGRTHIISGDIDIERFGVTPQEMSFDQLIETTASQIAVAFGVPPQLVGARGQLTYSNLREARLALYTDTVIPLLRKFYESLSRWASSLWPGGPYRIEPDLDAIDALKDERAALWDRVMSAGFLTIDEKREALGYSPLGGPAGSAILVSGNQVPIDMVAGPREA